MSYPQQVIATQPSPAYVINSSPVAYSYPQMPSSKVYFICSSSTITNITSKKKKTLVQSYYQSNQPQIIQQQPMGYYPGGQQMHDNHSGFTECCMGLL